MLARLWSGRMTETVGEVAGAVATDAAIGADGVEAIEELLQRLVGSVTVGHIVGMLGQVAAVVVVVVVCVVVISVGNRLRLMRIIGVFLLDAAARARARARDRDRTRSRSRTAAREHVIGIVVFGHCRGFTSSCTSSLFTLHSNHFADHFTNHFADALQTNRRAQQTRHICATLTIRSAHLPRILLGAEDTMCLR